MKANEFLSEEQIDELFGTKLPGVKSDTVNALKRMTGIGHGAANLQQVKQYSKQIYKRWLSIVPVLKQSGKIDGIDPEPYKDYLKYFVSKALKLDPNVDKQELADFESKVGNVPTAASIEGAIQQLVADAMVKKQVGTPPANQAQQATQQTGQATVAGSP